MSIADQVDCFFSQACTHWQLARISEYGPHIEMHSRRMKAYIRLMKELIRVHGDFSGKEDPSLRNLHLRENWRGDELPDIKMFDSMPWFSEFYPGQDLPADHIYLALVDHNRCLVPRKLAS